MIQQALRCSARVLATCERGRPHARLAYPFSSLTPKRGSPTAFLPLRLGDPLRLRLRPFCSFVVSAATSATMESQNQITYM